MKIAVVYIYIEPTVDVIIISFFFYLLGIFRPKKIRLVGYLNELNIKITAGNLVQLN